MDVSDSTDFKPWFSAKKTDVAAAVPGTVVACGSLAMFINAIIAGGCLKPIAFGVSAYSVPAKRSI